MGGDETCLRWPFGERLPRNSYFIMLLVVLLFCAIERGGKTSIIFVPSIRAIEGHGMNVDRVIWSSDPPQTK